MTTMRARQPDAAGYVERNGVKVGYEVFGHGTPTVLLLPAWTIVHTMFWKMQVPYLADHYRVVVFDRPGNGRADRTLDPEAYGVDAVVDQALAVLAATGTDAAVLLSLSQGSQEALKLGADHPGQRARRGPTSPRRCPSSRASRAGHGHRPVLRPLPGRAAGMGTTQCQLLVGPLRRVRRLLLLSMPA